MAASLAETLVRPLDVARRFAWRLTTKTAWGRLAVRDRAFRLLLLALGHMAVTLTLTLVAPLWLLLLGPIVLGFPHVVSDVRYLLVKPVAPFRPLGRTGLVLVLGPLALMTLLRVLPIVGGPSFAFGAALEVLLGFAAIAGALAVSRLGVRTKTFAIAATVALGASLAFFGHTTSLVVAHVHNLVAIGLWLMVYRVGASLSKVLVIAGAYVAILAALLSGALDGVLLWQLGGSAAGLDHDYMVASVAPGVEPMLALRLVTFYAFAQAFHYVVWLRLMPQRLDERPAPSTFARSIGRLRNELGRWGFGFVILVSVATPLAALVIPALPALDVRWVYLLVVIAHGWLEFSALAMLGADRLARRA